MDAETNSQEGANLNTGGIERKSPLRVFINDIRLVFKLDELGSEIAGIAFPAALALTADPIASLIDTAFIGRIGPVELAAVGVAIALFNQVSRVAIFPLVSVTTSFVAEEDVQCRSIMEGEKQDLKKVSTSSEGKEVVSNDCEKALSTVQNGDVACGMPTEDGGHTYEKTFHKNNEMKELIASGDSGKPITKSSLPESKYVNKNKFRSKKRHIPSVSTALVIGGVLGLLEAILLVFAGKPLLSFMGVKSNSPMLHPARQYLTLRSLGAPAVLLSLAMQGVFRGLKDTKTPLFATLAGDITNIILDPILIFVCHLGVSGAAIAHVISQYLISLILLLRLLRKVEILPPSLKDLQFSRFLKNGFLLLGRVIAATFCVTLAASLAARQGSIPMAAFQICLQVWLTTSLLADGLAVAGQAILATAFAEKDHKKAMKTSSRVLQLGMVLGLLLSVVLGVGMRFGSRIFTKDVKVIQLMHIGIPFVAATQPINSLAFVFDGINFGASDFAFSAYSMIAVSAVSVVCLWLLSSSYGFVGIWIGLTITMSLRMFAGFWRMGTARGPWTFLRS